MRELKTTLEDVLSGKGRLVMLAGEPGVGKTTTCLGTALALQELGYQPAILDLENPSMAGHTGVKTTVRYYHQEPSRLKEEYDQAARQP